MSDTPTVANSRVALSSSETSGLRYDCVVSGLVIRARTLVANWLSGPNRLIQVVCTMATCSSAWSVRPASRSLSASRYRANPCVRIVFAQDSDAVEQQLSEHRSRPFRGIGVAGSHGDRVPGAEHVRVIGALDADSVGEQFLEQLRRSPVPVYPSGVLPPDTQCLVVIGSVYRRHVVDQFGEPAHRLGLYAGLAELDGRRRRTSKGVRMVRAEPDRTVVEQLGEHRSFSYGVPAVQRRVQRGRAVTTRSHRRSRSFCEMFPR